LDLDSIQRPRILLLIVDENTTPQHTLAAQSIHTVLQPFTCLGVSVLLIKCYCIHLLLLNLNYTYSITPLGHFVNLLVAVLAELVY
jgi:hypothetical protein